MMGHLGNQGMRQESCEAATTDHPAWRHALSGCQMGIRHMLGLSQLQEWPHHQSVKGQGQEEGVITHQALALEAGKTCCLPAVCVSLEKKLRCH